MTNDFWTRLQQVFSGSPDTAQTFPASTEVWSPIPQQQQQGVLPQQNMGLGFNLGTGSLALQGLGALGNLWNASETRKLAKEQFDFTKGVTNTNLNNAIKSYNTNLEDRLRARGVTQGNSEAEINAQIERNRLTR